MRAFERHLGGKTGEFRHHANEGDGGHAADEGVVFGHVADERADGFRFGRYIVAENGSRAGGDGPET